MKTILLMLFLLSGGNFSTQTDLFKEYLHSKHTRKLSSTKTEYYVIRESNCYKCYIQNLELAKSKIKKKNTILIYVYKGRMKKEAKFLKQYNNVLYDSTEAFSRVNISPFSDCIIYTTKGKITKIHHLSNE